MLPICEVILLCFFNVFFYFLFLDFFFKFPVFEIRWLFSFASLETTKTRYKPRKGEKNISNMKPMLLVSIVVVDVAGDVVVVVAVAVVDVVDVFGSSSLFSVFVFS